MIQLAPLTLAHGDRYGKLTVLHRIESKKRGPKYRCACACGYPWVYVKARQLMKGEVKACRKCTSAAESGRPSIDQHEEKR